MLHEQAATHLGKRRINEPVAAEPALAAGRWTMSTSELPQPAASRTSTRPPPTTRHLAPAATCRRYGQATTLPPPNASARCWH